MLVLEILSYVADYKLRKTHINEKNTLLYFQLNKYCTIFKLQHITHLQK